MSDPNEYTVGWICAVETDYVAARVFLDKEHPKLASQDANDNNIYTLGSIGQHKVAIACLPHWNYGLVSAANIARDMLRTFVNIRFRLMVGIAKGVPTPYDIRFGDIVISSLDYEKGAVFQYNLGQTIQNKAFKITGYQNAPPLLLQTAVQNLKATYRIYGNQIDKTIAAILNRNPRLQKQYRRPNPATDRMYRTSCELDDANLIIRRLRSQYDDGPELHHGLVASRNKLIKNAVLRNRLARKQKVPCFEIKAAGSINLSKCLVIRGTCDYANSHKHEAWKKYAAMAAAAYAKDLLNTIAPSKVKVEKKISSLEAFIAGDGSKTIESSIQTNHNHCKAPKSEVDSDQSRELSSLLGSPILARLWYGLRRVLDPPPTGVQRVTYTCGCGDLRYLDVEELVPGGAAELQQMLQSAASAVRQHNPSPGDSTSSPLRIPRQIHLFSTGQSQQPHQGPIQNLPSLDRSGYEPDTTAYRSCSLSAAISEPKYLLLCVNTKRGLIKPEHVNVSSITNDQFLFQGIEAAYREIRKHSDWDLGMLFPRRVRVPEWLLRLLWIPRPVDVGLPQWLLSHLEDCRIFIPKTVEFAQFQLMPVRTEIYAGNIVKPEIPNEEEVRNKTYEYSPIPLKVKFLSIPFFHELLRPGEHLGCFWWKRFPKKLGGMLTWQEDLECIGWGIHISEGWNKKFIILLALLLIISFGTFVLIYSIITHDGSTGAGIRSFLVTTLSLYCWFRYEGWKSE